MKETKKFSSGDKIFAKVKGFVFWPARVNPLPEDVKVPNGKIPIFFFGTHEVYFISQSGCYPYDEKTKAKWGKPKSRAHFNQGMDEIENNPTIYQYIADPAGEEFLTQFYEFKMLNGEYNSLAKDDEDDDVIEEPIKEPVKERNKSGSSADNANKSTKSRSRSASGNDKNDTDDIGLKPNTMKTNRKRKSDEDEVEEFEGSETPSMDSDNVHDEDFELPAKKARTAAPTKEKKPPRKSAGPNKKSERKPRKTADLKRVMATKKVDKDELDSLSSISDGEDWKTKDDRDKKVLEQKLEELHQEQLKKEVMVVNEVTKITRDRRKSEAKVKEEISLVEIEKIKEEIPATETVVKCDMEIKVHLTKTDIKFEADPEEEVSNAAERAAINSNSMEVEEHTQAEDIPKETIASEVLVTDEIKVTETDKISENQEITKTVEKEKTPEKPKQKKDRRIVSSDESVDLDKKVEIPVKERPKKSTKPQKKEAVKKSNVSAKRGRNISISDSDDDIRPVPKKQKRIEVTRKKAELLSDDEDITLRNNNLVPLEMLQSLNADIRCSLTLGHEDYNKCLATFRTICDMDIKIFDLVDAWQLMDTVKKCRKYKRNDDVRNMALDVYKKFLAIYSNADPEEITKAQAILAENRNVSKDDKTNGKSVTNGTIGSNAPISVDDLFQNRSAPTLDATVANGSDKTKEQSPEVDNQEEPEANEEERMKRLTADLDAKANDVLNKIEKNIPLNQKSLSHLLPTKVVKAPISLPSEWQSVHKDGSKEDKHSTKDSDDEDDVEAIYRKIEEVPIKPCDNYIELEHPVIKTAEPMPSPVAAGTSTLDARIANLINSSMSAKSEQRQQHKKPQHRSSRSSHRQHSSIPLSPKSSSSRVSLEPTFKPVHTATKPVTVVEEPPAPAVQTKDDDNELYDLLDV